MQTDDIVVRRPLASDVVGRALQQVFATDRPSPPEFRAMIEKLDRCR